MIHAGIGARHVNAFLSTIEVPSISKVTLKRRERDVGPYFELTARKSCSRASQEEKKLTLDTSNSLEKYNDAPAVLQNTVEQLTLEETMAILEIDNEGMKAMHNRCTTEYYITVVILVPG